MIWLIHVIAVIFFFPALILTIPLHLILNAVKSNKPAPVAAETAKAVPYKEGRISDRNKAILGIALIIALAVGLGAIGA